MKKTGTDILYYETSRLNEPTMYVEPGEKVLVETMMATSDWLKNADDKWRPERRQGPGNPSSGCIFVTGCEPGSVMKVKIEQMELADLGYTSSSGKGMNPFREKEWGLLTKTVRIRDGFVEWSEHIKIPIRPTIGFMATAPAAGSFPNRYNGPYGGNLDAQELTVGASVFLPVFVPGGLLHIGDIHAVQGDGEICGGGGIETSADVELSLEVEQAHGEMNWPRIENETHIGTIACAKPAEHAFRIALREMIEWLAAGYGMEKGEAFMLLSQIAECRCTQFVNPSYTYVCKVDRRYLR